MEPWPEWVEWFEDNGNALLVASAVASSNPQHTTLILELHVDHQSFFDDLSPTNWQSDLAVWAAYCFGSGVKINGAMDFQSNGLQRMTIVVESPGVTDYGLWFLRKKTAGGGAAGPRPPMGSFKRKYAPVANAIKDLTYEKKHEERKKKAAWGRR